MPNLYKLKILLVDSNLKDSTTVSFELAKTGMQVFRAYGVLDAKNQLSLVNFDLIITRLDRSDSNLLELLEFNRECLAFYPIVLMGDKNEKEVSKEWLEACDQYLRGKDTKKKGERMIALIVKERKLRMGKAA
jgi:PleD family two-component response regulator